MKTKKSEYVERFTVGVNADTVKAIQKSGQSAPDWLRQAARNQIEGARQAETPTGKLEKQIEGLQKEMARLQQSESIAQAALAEMRKTLAAIQQNQVELRRSLDQINAGFGHAFTTLGQSLLVALGQQLDRYAQKLAAKEDETPPFVLPPIPPRTRL
jgi:predicted  nucleic acid-binding Zn-ribbon protein